MATDASAAPSSRPRPWLLVALGVVVVVFLLTQMFSGGAGGPAVTTGGARPPARAAQQSSEHVDPAELDVRIEALRSPAPLLAEGDRNPFRFQPKPPPPPPPSAGRTPAPTVTAPPVPYVDPGPPPPPPIGNTIKFIGIVETNKGKIGAFTDCRATFPGREGEVIEGRYRVVRIGLESAVLEYPDGKGRATLPLNGSACVK